MSWRQKRSLGEEFVSKIYDTFQVDERYVLDHPDGFTYWSGDLATTVRTDPGLFRQSQVTYRVTATTEFIRGRGRVPEVILALEEILDHGTMSGAVYDPQTDVFALECGVYATEDNAEFTKGAMAAAVCLQVNEAMVLSTRLAEHLRTSIAYSAHPTQGPRSAVDESLSHTFEQFTASGAAPNRWRGQPEWQQAEWVMEREAITFESDHQSRIHATFPWHCGGQPIDFLVGIDEVHPRLGAGLHATLVIPMPLPKAGIGKLALNLNHYEANEYKRCHTLGSWCMHDDKLAFRLFVPNLLYTPQALTEVCVAMATRAIWVDEWFVALRQQAAPPSS